MIKKTTQNLADVVLSNHVKTNIYVKDLNGKIINSPIIVGIGCSGWTDQWLDRDQYR